MGIENQEKQYVITGGVLEAIRKNVSMLSKIPLFMALPITILLALGISLSPLLYSLILAALPVFIIGAAAMGFINFLINLKNAKKRCEHNLIPCLEEDLANKNKIIAELNNEINQLVNNPKISLAKRKKIAKILAAIEKNQGNVIQPESGLISKILKKLPSYIELFFKYFVIIPGSIGAFGGILFLAAMSNGINVFQMGAIVTFMSLTGIGGIVAFGIVIGISLIAMIALFIYKAKFEEKISCKHKEIHEKELSLFAENKNLDNKIAQYIKLKNKLQKKSTLQQTTLTDNLTTTVIPTDYHGSKLKFYDRKKTRSYIISGSILAAINEAVFMFSKYITFTGLCIVVLGGIGVTFSPLFFIGLTAILSIFTLIMAGIGVSKFLGAVNNVNKLSDDPILEHLRSHIIQQPLATAITLNNKQKDLKKYDEFLAKLESKSGLLGLLINKLSILKLIEKAADNFPVIKNHFRAIEAVIRYSFLFAVSLGSLTSATILAAGIAGVGITGLGAILSASILSGFGIPVVAVVIIGLTLLIAGALIYYKKNYENPLAKAQRDAANEKAKLIELTTQAKTHVLATVKTPISPLRKTNRVSFDTNEPQIIPEPYSSFTATQTSVKSPKFTQLEI